ncbi:MAG TPA: HAMP domain-containing sensor histidine kinase [Candidatus Moranbacteria bacterium]|nr:HAMP domain-containing sensor histidine kinase [Candidatus Moranbacteria bacterium]
MGFISDYLIEHNVTDATSAYGYELYGLFGMPIFLGFLVYLIVQYKAFDIKILSVQALVVALVILIGSQFAFIQNPINMVLTGITLAIAVGFGWTLIRSVKMEVQRKEELQIMTNRLAQANDQLRKLDNAKSEFISIASHQLRTPLTAIKGFISLLLEGSYGKINSMLKDVLNKIYISNERLIDLVEDMLNLSRIESGRMEYDIKKVNMEEVLKEICDTFSIRSKEKGLKLELKLPENPLPEVTTDRNKIREVISNLVDNAIKYTLKGWVTVKLSQNEDKVRIAVIDTGIGVPKEEMPYLFEKFSRGKDINRLNTGGTGLGLHVGKKMIESLSGKLWVESEGAGKGSTFIVELPVEIKEAK